MGPKIENVDEGSPLGEMLTCLPVRGAEAVKKTCWSSAWEMIRTSLFDRGLVRLRRKGGGPNFASYQEWSPRTVPLRTLLNTDIVLRL